MLSRLLFIGLILIGLLSIIDARSIRLSPHAETRLTHTKDYEPPSQPHDIFRYAQQQFDMIEQDSMKHDFLSLDRFGGEQPQQLPLCSSCQVFIQVAEWVASSNTSMSLVEVLLDDICTKVRPNSTQECDSIVSIILSFGEKIPPIMKHVGLYEPIRACSFLGLCSVTCCQDQETPNQVALVRRGR